MNPSELRSLGLVSYFGQSNDAFDFRFASRVPYQVPWNTVALQFIIDDVALNQSLVALNGMIVGLCVSDEQLHTCRLPNELMIVPSSAQTNANCIGLGLIRSIDPDSRSFYIISPVTRDLDKVNLIIRGPMEIPSVFMEEGAYTTFLFSFGAGAYKHRNRHIQRRMR
jgi:hypothetical protein